MVLFPLSSEFMAVYTGQDVTDEQFTAAYSEAVELVRAYAPRGVLGDDPDKWPSVAQIVTRRCVGRILTTPPGSVERVSVSAGVFSQQLTFSTGGFINRHDRVMLNSLRPPRAYGIDLSPFDELETK